jgi:hypothetical protein
MDSVEKGIFIMNGTALPDFITTTIRSHNFGVLGTYGGEYPHLSLVTIDYSTDDRRLVFPTLRETQKFANLLHESRASVLLDNRSFAAIDPESLYTLTILGTACEVDPAERPALEQHFLKRHPNLTGFLRLPQTALIQVTLMKVVLVEGLQNKREFYCAQE